MLKKYAFKIKIMQCLKLRNFSTLLLLSFFLISCATNKSQQKNEQSLTLNSKPNEEIKKIDFKKIDLDNLANQNILTQLLIAEVAMTNQKFETALNIYWRLAKKQKNPDLAQRSLYVAQFVDEKIMLESAMLWANLGTKNIEAQKVAAGLLLENGLYLKSLKYLERLAKLENSSKYMLLINSMIQKNIDLLPKTLPSLKRSEANIQPNADLFTALAFVYHYLEDSQKTKMYLKKALKLDKDFLSAILLQANILKREQNFKKAEKILLAAQRRNPDQIRIYLNLAKLQIENGKKDLAVKTIKKMLKYANKDAETSLVLADYLFSVDMFDEAQKLAESLIKSKKYKDRANLLLAQISVQKNKIDDAFSFLNQVNTTSAGFIEASYTGAILANEFYNANKAEIWLYEKKDYATQNIPEDLIEFLATGYKALFQINADLQVRKKWLDEAINLVSDIGLDDSELIYARSFYWHSQGDLVSMEADLRNLVENNKDNSKYINALAYILVDEDENLAHSEKQARYKEGLKLAQRAYDLEKNLAILDTLGWALYKNGKFENAKKYLQEARSLAPKDDEIGTHLILVLWAMGDTKAAKKLIQDLLKLGQKNAYLKKTLKSKPYLKP